MNKESGFTDGIKKLRKNVDYCQELINEIYRGGKLNKKFSLCLMPNYGAVRFNNISTDFGISTSISKHGNKYYCQTYVIDAKSNDAIELGYVKSTAKEVIDYLNDIGYKKVIPNESESDLENKIVQNWFDTIRI